MSEGDWLLEGRENKVPGCDICQSMNSECVQHEAMRLRLERNAARQSEAILLEACARTAERNRRLEEKLRQTIRELSATRADRDSYAEAVQESQKVAAFWFLQNWKTFGNPFDLQTALKIYGETNLPDWLLDLSDIEATNSE